jgi:hypothetical protein
MPEKRRVLRPEEPPDGMQKNEEPVVCTRPLTGEGQDGRDSEAKARSVGEGAAIHPATAASRAMLR